MNTCLGLDEVERSPSADRTTCHHDQVRQKPSLAAWWSSVLETGTPAAHHSTLTGEESKDFKSVFTLLKLAIRESTDCLVYKLGCFHAMLKLL